METLLETGRLLLVAPTGGGKSLIYQLPAALLFLALAAGPVAAQIALDDVQIETVPVADGIYMMTGAGGNLGVSTGPDGVVLIDDLYTNEWMFVPHFYFNMYVYQYATSQTAGTALYAKIVEDGEAGVENYKNLLRAGGSNYPYLLLADAGVDVIKLIDHDQMTPEEAHAVVDEAHKHGLPVVAHSHRPDEIRRGLEIGVDNFEHTGLTTAPGYPDDIMDLLKERTATGRVSGGPLYWTPTVEGLWQYDEVIANPEHLDNDCWHRGLEEDTIADIEQRQLSGFTDHPGHFGA
mgnify:CR=1 FL=1